MASTIQVDTIKDIGGNTIISSNGSGTFTSNLPASGATLTGSTNNQVTTVTGANAIQGEANLRFDGSELRVGSGTTSAQANGDDVVVEGSANTGLTILSGANDLASVYLGQNGANNDCKFEYDNDTNALVVHTNATEVMKIDGNGIVTKPKQPLFKVQQTGALTVADGHTVFSTNVTEAYDVNADFSGGAFTAPVSGYYHFSATVLYSGLSAGTDDTMEDRIVSSNQTETYSRFGFVDNAFVRQGYAQTKCSTILFMDANDTCYIQHFDGGTMAVYAQAPYSHFQGCLLQ